MAQPKKTPKPKKDTRTARLLAELIALTAQNTGLVNDNMGLERALEEDRRVHRMERAGWDATVLRMSQSAETGRSGERVFRKLANEHATANEKLRGEVENLTAIATAIVAAAAMEFGPVEFAEAVTGMLQKMGQSQTREMADLIQKVLGEGYAAGVKHNLKLAIAGSTFPPSLDEFFEEMRKVVGGCGNPDCPTCGDEPIGLDMDGLRFGTYGYGERS